jgi:6-phosphogluconolactonase
MNIARRHTAKLLSLALALSLAGPAARADGDGDGDEDDGYRSGHVFTSTNAATGNELLVYARDGSGQLTLRTRLATQGQGTAGGLGNQGAVTLSGSGRHLFVVNALSNSVSTFRIRRSAITLESTVDSGGQQPVSVTEHDGTVYVLNAGGAANVTGFRNLAGTLKAIGSAVGALSAASGTGAAQVGFSPDGDTLLVTEKGTNKLTSYRVLRDGRLDTPTITASSGMTPFGFAFDRLGHALVSEAFGGAPNASALSSYAFDNSAPSKPLLVSGSVADTQTAACWVVVTPNGRHAYATNTGSNTISRYAVQRSGRLTLGSAVAANSGAGPIDAAVSPPGRELHVLNAGSHTISSFAVAHDGSLGSMKVVGGLPAGATGLAAN